MFFYKDIISILRLFYSQIFLRFSKEIRNPYFLKIDKIFIDDESRELMITFHIINKRAISKTSVEEFIKNGFIYFIDPQMVFEIGSQYGSYVESIKIKSKKMNKNLKEEGIRIIKRVFVDHF